MTRLVALLDRLVWYGLLAIVVVSPTQYALEISKKTFVSVADPLVWGVFGLWAVSWLLQRRAGPRFVCHTLWIRPDLRGTSKPAGEDGRPEDRGEGTPAPEDTSSPLVPPPLMAVLFVGIAALSLIGSIHPLKGVKDIVQWVEYFIVTFMLFANVPRRIANHDRTLEPGCPHPGGFGRDNNPAIRERLAPLLNLFLAVASLVILVGVVQYFLPGTPDFKVSATFGNRNVFGGYLALVVPLMVGVALYETALWRRIGLLAVSVLALLITLSGGAMLAIAVTLGLLCALRGKAAFIAFAAVFIVMFVLVLPRLPRHNDVVLDESVRLFNDNNEVSLRYTEWQAATVMIAEHPWLGVGIGNYQDNIGGYFGVLPRPTGVVEHDSENLYLVIASSTGWLGLAAFLGLLFTFGITATRRFFTLTDSRDRGIALGLLGAILSFAICAVWHPLLVRGIGIPLAIIFAMTAWLERGSTATAD
jgi:hypothetical protein